MVSAAFMVTHKKQKPKKDDGVPYEKLDTSLKDMWVDARDLRDRLVWYPASPFAVVFLNQILNKLFLISDHEGTIFLRNLGLETTRDIPELLECSGVTIAEMTRQAILSIPLDLRVEIGLT